MSADPPSILDRARQEERQVCIRALLQTPLLLNEGRKAETLRLIRRHVSELRDWFHQYPAWHLHVERDFARLEKSPDGTGDGTRGLSAERNAPPFSPRRYVMLCLTLAALEKGERQTILGELAAEVERLGRADPVLEAAGMGVDFERRDARQDLVNVVRVLVETGVLLRVHGNEDSFVQQREEVLYTVRRSVLARMLCVRTGPSTVRAEDLPSRLAALQREQVPESDEARRRTLRTTLYRRLLDSPVLYYADLREDERAFLQNQRGNITRNIHQATGLVAELRAEGIAMVDPLRKLTDHAMPEEGTDGHAALLLAEMLADHLRESRSGTGIPLARLESFLADCAREHGARWRRDARDPAGQRQLLHSVLFRLQALNLLRHDGDRVLPLPAIARYRLTPEENQRRS